MMDRKSGSSHYHNIVVKLTRKTADGEIEWRRISEPNLMGGHSDAFVAEHDGRQFRIQDALSYIRHRGEGDLGEGVATLMSRRRHVLEISGGPQNKRIVFPRMRVVDNLAHLIKAHEESDLQQIEQSLDS